MAAKCDGKLNATGGCPKCGNMARMLSDTYSANRPEGDSCYRGEKKLLSIRFLSARRARILGRMNASEDKGGVSLDSLTRRGLRLLDAAIMSG